MFSVGMMHAYTLVMATPNYSKKIVKVHEYKGDLKMVELSCGHRVERSVWSGRPLPKSGKLTCHHCADAARNRNDQQADSTDD